MSKSRKDVFKEGVDTYSVNLLWINQKKDESLKYIHPAKNAEGVTNDEQTLIDKLLNPSLKWAKENRKKDNAEIKIWYDSNLHTPEQMENTKQILSKLAEEQGTNNITLNDINEIEFVKNNKFLFSENMPLYFRIDFLKLIIIAHELITEKKDGAAFSDTSICDLRENEYGEISGQRFDKTELFAVEYMKMMEEYSIITNSRNGQSSAPENQFIQMVNDEKAVDSLRYVINACLMRVVEILNASKDFQLNLMEGLYNIPFESTIKELSKLYIGLKTNNLEINEGFIKNNKPNDQWIKYHSEQHGYTPLGNFLECRDRIHYSVDFKQNPPEIICRADQSISFGPISYNHGTRDCFVREGGAHSDKFVLPEEGHAPFVPCYWEDEVEIIG